MHCIAMKSWQLLFQKQCEVILFMKQRRMGDFMSVPEHIWMELSLRRSVCFRLFERFRYCLVSNMTIGHYYDGLLKPLPRMLHTYRNIIISSSFSFLFFYCLRAQTRPIINISLCAEKPLLCTGHIIISPAHHVLTVEVA